MKVLRTPEERFDHLPDYPFQANYFETSDFEGGMLRMHYVDEGPQEGEVVLMLHGEPSWSFLYRKMIPFFSAEGYRAVAPDLVGFGKSDKPSKKEDYTYQRHLDWLYTLIEHLDLRKITLVCQDWGGLLGLRLVARHPYRFARVVVANTMLPTGEQKVPKAFKAWQTFSQTVPVLPIGKIIKTATVTSLAKEVVGAYNAPFPKEAYKAGARVFPALVPVTPDNPEAAKNKDAWEELKKSSLPWLTAFSDKDDITRGGDKVFQKLIPGTKDQPHTTIEDAGHFLQEDKGEELAKVVLDFMKLNPLS